MFDIIGKRFWFFTISGIVILIGIISLIVFGLPAGIEFNSGDLLTVQFEQPVNYDEFKEEINNLGYTDAIIQSAGENQFLIRTQVLTDAEKQQIKNSLSARFGEQAEEPQFIEVSPQVASEASA